MKVIVIQNSLKYTSRDEMGKIVAIKPKMGDMIDLPKEIALIELKTKNVRRLLPEEKESLNEEVEEKEVIKKKKKKKKKKISE